MPIPGPKYAPANFHLLPEASFLVTLPKCFDVNAAQSCFTCGDKLHITKPTKVSCILCGGVFCKGCCKKELDLVELNKGKHKVCKYCYNRALAKRERSHHISKPILNTSQPAEIELPSLSVINIELEKFLDATNIHSEVEREIFRKFSPEKKWAFISSLQENYCTRTVPDQCISDLQSDPLSLTAINDVRLCLSTHSVWWTLQFLAKNGLYLLAESFSMLLNAGTQSSNFNSTMCSLISCFHSIFNTEEGFELFQENIHLIEMLCGSIQYCQSKEAAKLFEILSSLCILSPEIHKVTSKAVIEHTESLVDQLIISSSSDYQKQWIIRLLVVVMSRMSDEEAIAFRKRHSLDGIIQFLYAKGESGGLSNEVMMQITVYFELTGLDQKRSKVELNFDNLLACLKLNDNDNHKDVINEYTNSLTQLSHLSVTREAWRFLGLSATLTTEYLRKQINNAHLQEFESLTNTMFGSTLGSNSTPTTPIITITSEIPAEKTLVEEKVKEKQYSSSPVIKEPEEDTEIIELVPPIKLRSYFESKPDEKSESEQDEDFIMVEDSKTDVESQSDLEGDGNFGKGQKHEKHNDDDDGDDDDDLAASKAENETFILLSNNNNSNDGDDEEKQKDKDSVEAKNGKPLTQSQFDIVEGDTEGGVKRSLETKPEHLKDDYVQSTDENEINALAAPSISPSLDTAQSKSQEQEKKTEEKQEKKEEGEEKQTIVKKKSDEYHFGSGAAMGPLALGKRSTAASEEPKKPVMIVHYRTPKSVQTQLYVLYGSLALCVFYILFFCC